jgi:hypothetical protein
LGDPSSIFSRAAKMGEAYLDFMDPYHKEDQWNYPLSIADGTADLLRAFSPTDPIFSEIIPLLTIKNGTNYSNAKVVKLRRDGINIVHDGGTEFIHRDNLTEQQQGKYQTSWQTEVLKPEGLIHNVNSAMEERDNDLKTFTTAVKWDYDKRLTAAKFDFERENLERNLERTLASTIRKHCYDYSARLFELAYAANEFGQKEAMERIEKELSEPVPEPYKSQLLELNDKNKEHYARYKDTYAILKKNCRLLRDGQPIAEGIPKRWELGSLRIEVPAPEYIQFTQFRHNISSKWVFKLNLESGEAILLPEASSDTQQGIVSFSFEK